MKLANFSKERIHRLQILPPTWDILVLSPRQRGTFLSHTPPPALTLALPAVAGIPTTCIVTVPRANTTARCWWARWWGNVRVVFKTRSDTVSLDYTSNWLLKLRSTVILYTRLLHMYRYHSIWILNTTKCGKAQRRYGRVPVPSLRLCLLDSTAVYAHMWTHLCVRMFHDIPLY